MFTPLPTAGGPQLELGRDPRNRPQTRGPRCRAFWRHRAEPAYGVALPPQTRAGRWGYRGYVSPPATAGTTRSPLVHKEEPIRMLWGQCGRPARPFRLGPPQKGQLKCGLIGY